MRNRYLLFSVILASLPALDSHACHGTLPLRQEDRERADLVVFGTPIRYDGEVLELKVEETFKGLAKSETIRISMTRGVDWSAPKDLNELTYGYGARLGVGLLLPETIEAGCAAGARDVLQYCNRSGSMASHGAGAEALPVMIVPLCTSGYIFSTSGAFELFGYGSLDDAKRDRIRGWEGKLKEAGFKSLSQAFSFLFELRHIAARRDKDALADRIAFRRMTSKCTGSECEIDSNGAYASKEALLSEFERVVREDVWKALETIRLTEGDWYFREDPIQVSYSNPRWDPRRGYPFVDLQIVFESGEPKIVIDPR